MLIGPNGKEHESLINKIYNTQRQVYACEYDGKPIKAWFLKLKLKRLQRKEDKMLYIDYKKRQKEKKKCQKKD